MEQSNVLDPNPAVLIESLRDIGYSIESAIADIVDNSISAGAENVSVSILAGEDGLPFVEVSDDGHGLTREKLREAMRLGTTSPREERSEKDLGRFGLGLKTASFSQCRKLVVTSRCDGEENSFAWDLDHVVETNLWEVLEGPTHSCEPGVSGTVVRWEKVDRVYLSARHPLGEVAELVGEHLSLVFHRFLSGEVAGSHIAIRVNGRDLEPLDPFNSMHPRSIATPSDPAVKGVTVQAVTLPHRNDYQSESEYERYSLGSYLKAQGIYLYRANRLIVYGSWFRIIPATTLTQLCRVRLDIDNSQDETWKIDVKKNHAELPPEVRSRIKKLVTNGSFVSGAQKKMKRQAGLVIEKEYLPVWQKQKDPDTHETSYRIDRGHPLVQEVLKESPKAKAFLSLIEASFPVEDVALEVTSNSDAVHAYRQSDDEKYETARAIVASIVADGKTSEEAIRLIAPMTLFDGVDINNLFT